MRVVYVLVAIISGWNPQVIEYDDPAQCEANAIRMIYKAATTLPPEQDWYIACARIEIGSPT